MRIAKWKASALGVALLALAACGSEADRSGSAADTALSDDAAEGAGAAGLQAYVGHYPFEEVDGVAWNDHHAVLAGIRASITDEAVRNAVLELEGPSVPIELIEGRISSWACEQHNCGDHQWLVMVDPATGGTDVCYHNAGQVADQSRWFLAAGGEEMRPGNCSVE